jgi:flagellar biosynthesis GTPase FlhF
MKMKKYIVKTLSEVDSMIYQDLGPNAVILVVRQIKYKGIKSLFFSDQLEVVAAADESEVMNSPKPNLPQAEEPAKEWESPMPTIEEFSNAALNKALPGLEEPAQYEISKIPGTYLDPRFNRKQVAETANEHAIFQQTLSDLRIKNRENTVESGKADPQINTYETELNNLERAFQGLLEKFAFSTEASQLESPTDKENKKLISNNRILKNLMKTNVDNIPPFSLVEWLLSKEINLSLAAILAENLQNRYKSPLTLQDVQGEDFAEYLSQEIMEMIPVTGPLLISKGTPTCMLLVGPPNIGKTLTLIKIAFQYASDGGKKVIILSVDLDKSASNEKLQNDCHELGLSVAFAKDIQELDQKRQQHQNYDLILLDIPGFSEFQEEPFVEWTDYLKTINNLYVQLALNADIENEDIEKWISFYSILTPRALVLIIMDETLPLTCIPLLCKLSMLPVSYLSLGHSLREGLCIADSTVIAKAILNQEFNYSFV